MDRVFKVYSPFASEISIVGFAAAAAALLAMLTPETMCHTILMYEITFYFVYTLKSPH